MGWFDEQIRERLQEDEDFLDEAYLNLSSILLGKKALAASLNNDAKQADDAINSVLRYYGFKGVEIPREISDLEGRIDVALRPYGMMSRLITLNEKWYQDAVGPLICVTTEGDIVALIPGKSGGYRFFSKEENCIVRLNEKNSSKFDRTAASFYRPLPNKSMNGKDLFRFMFSNIGITDVVKLVISSIVVILLGFLTPYATNIIFNYAIPQDNQMLLAAIFSLLLGSCVSVSCISIIKNLLVEQTVIKIGTATEAALVARLISLPMTFFRKFSAGELSSRASSVTLLSQVSVRILFTLGLSSLCSLLYLVQVFTYTPSLLVPAISIIILQALYIVVLAKAQIKVTNKKLTENSKLEGMTSSIFSGVEKIKLAGAERRLFSIWLKGYSKVAQYTYDPPFIVKVAKVIPLFITTFSTILFYWIAITNSIAVAEFMAFTSAFGMICATFTLLSPAMEQVATITPILNLVKPILEEEPEIQQNKQPVGRLSGSIELEKVSFRYGSEMPLILDNLNLKIKRGDYVAIVGNTGCGKSTLLRLLIGLESPDKGAIYYDKKDMSSFDIQSLRQKIGVVLQDSRIISGSIYENICVSAKDLSEEEVWQVLEDSGLADDVRDMPMKLQTVLSDGDGGISGGQKQRLMIARAIAAKPKILILDEATSALDNITQKKISESLDKMKSTRIIIAHRLSTIRQCNRILVLEKGRIVADGSYEQLLEENAFFQELVSRQSL